MRKSLTSFFSIEKKISEKIKILFNNTFKSWYDKKSESLRIFPFLPVLVLEGVCEAFLQYENARFEKIFQTTEAILKLDQKKRTLSEDKCYQEALHKLDSYANEALKSPRCKNLLSTQTEEEAKSFIKLMFFAGVDTTSVLLEFLVFILGQQAHMSYQETLYNQWIHSKKEMEDFVSSSNELTSIINEALRLHPPSFEQIVTCHGY